jgi:hypothetical protein
LITGKVIRLLCALDESGETDFHKWQYKRKAGRNGTILTRFREYLPH